MANEQNIVFFDLETQRSADEVGGWKNVSRMGLSVGVTWSTKEKLFIVFREETVKDLLEELKSADVVVGYNHVKFDYEVLRGYTDFDFRNLNSFDIMQDVKSRLNHRLKLDDIASATLQESKSHHYGVQEAEKVDGLKALEWWKEGKVDLIAAYCRQDVKVTRDIYFYGRKNNCVYYMDRDGRKVRLPVEW